YTLFLPAAPAVFAHRPPVPGKAATLQIRILPDRLEVVLHEGGRVVTDVQLLDAPDAGQRLAGRLWACLPFGDAPRRRVSPRRLHLDAGFAWFVYTKAPVELFGNVGVSATASWSVARYLALEASAALTNSGRDREEDLRAEVPVGRFTAGPAFATDAGRLRAVAGVGVEVAVIGPVETTTNPACKYFRPGDVPARLCDFDQDVDQRETAWAVGPTVTLGASLRLVDAIYLGVRAQGAVYVFRTLDNGLDRPVGGQLVLGYQLF
ncbi:MAG: hypothetical protein KC549_19405, partial [Myxococcales bacterium]|nr:hypothetical protein [Myxococcales bacterium]